MRPAGVGAQHASRDQLRGATHNVTSKVNSPLTFALISPRLPECKNRFASAGMVSEKLKSLSGMGMSARSLAQGLRARPPDTARWVPKRAIQSGAMWRWGGEKRRRLGLWAI